jgi:hypothetical protein
MSDTTKRNQVSVRLDERTLETIERVAAAENRPVANLLRTVLSDWADGRPPRISAEAA